MPAQIKPQLQSGLLSAKDYEQLSLERGYCYVGEGEGYDPEAVEERALEQPAAVLARAAKVAWSLGRFYAVLKLDEWQGNTGQDAVRQRSRELREMLIDLGPCYIKVGQALANRPDILRDDYMVELEELQDRVPPFPTQEARRILHRELGRAPGDIFSELSAEPVAAASLGQVYRGKLRSTGEEVAVKVQRPDLETALCVDMYIFRQFAQLLNDWARQNLGCNITLVVDEFGAKLWEEANYAVEAINAQTFERNFAGDPMVKIPKIFTEHSSEKVITMEWISGVKSTDLEGLRRARIDVDAFISNGVQAALRQLLEFGLFHGDPHAGNVFAMQDGRIAYVDFGNVATLTRKQRSVILQAITHVSNSDYAEIANDFVRLGFLRPGTDVSQIVPAMADIWKDSMGKTIRDFNFRTVTARFNQLVYQFPIRVPERFSLVIRALLMQEGICLCINPDFSIITVALPYASKRLLSDPDPSLRRELMNIVFRDDGTGRPVFQWERVRSLVEMARQARDGASIDFADVVVDFFRGFRRDLLQQADEGRVAQVVRDAVRALSADGRPRLEELRQLIDLLAPDLTPLLARKVADALLRDSVQDLLAGRGVEVSQDDLSNPLQLGRALASSPEQLGKLLPPLPQPPLPVIGGR